MAARFILALWASLLAACTSMPVAAPKAAPMVVLKLDDFRADGNVHPGWAQAFRFLDAHDVVASVGVIGEGLERPDPRAVEWLLASDARGHEVWNHGYCHCRSGAGVDEIREFRGAPLARQAQAIMRTQKLGEQVLGLSFTAFGAPYNSTDTATAQALAQVETLTVWMFKETSAATAPTTKRQLARIAAVNIEYPVHIPDFDQFLAGYQANRDAPVLVLQGHPQSWVDEPERLAQFQRIVLYLKADGAQFITPTAAAAAITKKAD